MQIEVFQNDLDELFRCGGGAAALLDGYRNVAVLRRIKLLQADVKRHSARHKLRENCNAKSALDHSHDRVVVVNVAVGGNGCVEHGVELRENLGYLVVCLVCELYDALLAETLERI